MSSTIDQLNFKVILDDKSFDAKVRKDIELAKKLNVQLTQLLAVKAKVAGMSAADATSAKRASDVAAKEAINKAKVAAATANAAKAQARLNIENERYNQLLNRQSVGSAGMFKRIQGALIGGTAVMAATRLLREMVSITGEFEMQKTTLRAILQDIQGADKIFERIKGLAIVSPFNFKQLITYTKQLSAYSVPIEQLYDTTKMLADLSAGLGVGMDRLVLAYGQVRSAAVLRGQEVRQFTEAGIPILHELAKLFEEVEGRMITVGEVFDKISARQVPFEMVDRVLKSMTEEGGKFYKMQEVQAETLKGKIANLTDAYHIMFSEIGERGEGIMKRTVDNLRYMMYFYEDTGRKIMELVAVYGIYRATLFVVKAATDAAVLANTRLVRSFTAILTRMVANPYAALAAAVAGLGYAIYKAATAETAFERAQRRVNDAVDKFNASIGIEESKLRMLFRRLESAEVGTKKYNEAKSEVLRNYDSYLDAMDKENLSAGNLTEVYKKLTDAIREASAERAYMEGERDLSEDYYKIYRTALDNLQIALDAGGDKVKASAAELGAYVRGTLDFEDLSEDAKRSMAYIRDSIIGAKSEIMFKPGSGMYPTSSYSDIYSNVMDIESIRKMVDDAEKIYEQALESLRDKVGAHYTVLQSTSSNTERQLSETALKIQAIFRKFGIESQQKAFGLWADESFDRTKYLEDLRKSYAEIGDKIRDAGDASDSILPGLEKQKEIIEEIARVMQIDLVLKKEGGSGKSQAQKDLEEQIRMIEDVKKAYEKLSEYLDGQTLSDTLSAIFTDLDDKDLLAKFDFRERIIKLALELAKFDKEASAKVLASLATDKADEVAKQLQIFEKYKEAMADWESKDFAISGEGILLDIEMAVRGMNNAYADADKRGKQMLKDLAKVDTDNAIAVKAIREQYGDEIWQRYVEGGENAIKLLTDAEKNAAKVIAQDKITSLADGFVKEVLERNNLDLTDWYDKSLGQIDFILNKLNELQKGSDWEVILQSDDLQAKLEESGLSVDALITKIRQLFAGKYEMVVVEKAKKLESTIKNITSAVADLGGMLSDLGDTMGSDWLRGFGAALQEIQKITDALVENESLMRGFVKMSKDASGDLSVAKDAVKGMETIGKAAEDMKNVANSANMITMIIKIALIKIERIVNKIKEFVEGQKRLRQQAIDYKHALDEIARGHYDTIFGVDNLGLLAENWRIATEAAERYNDVLKKTQDADALKSANRIERKTAKALKKIEKRSKLFFNRSIYLDDGTLDMKYISTYFDDLTKFVGYGKKRALQRFIDMYDEMEETSEVYKDSIKQIFSSISSDIADNVIDSFLATGDALFDLEMGFQSLGRTIVESMMQSYIIEEILNNFQKPLDDLMSSYSAGILSYEEYMSNMGGLFDQMKDAMVVGEDAITSMLVAAQESGLLMSDMSGAKTLGNEIKGVTEDTAQLLASYLNAIRADVATNRVNVAGMSADLKLMLSLIPQAPTLTDYLNNIQANTYNSAENSRQILERLNSVIGSHDNGGQGINVNVAMS